MTVDTIGFNWDGTQHVIRNSHDLAASMAAHNIAVRARADGPLPHVRDVFSGLDELEFITLRGRLRTSRMILEELQEDMSFFQRSSRTPVPVSLEECVESDDDAEPGWQRMMAP
eukprot:6216252-Amphidinium_carterae.1